MVTGAASTTDLLFAVGATGYTTKRTAVRRTFHASHHEAGVTLRRTHKTVLNVTDCLGGATASPLDGGLAMKLRLREIK